MVEKTEMSSTKAAVLSKNSRGAINMRTMMRDYSRAFAFARRRERALARTFSGSSEGASEIAAS